MSATRNGDPIPGEPDPPRRRSRTPSPSGGRSRRSRESERRRERRRSRSASRSPPRGRSYSRPRRRMSRSRSRSRSRSPRGRGSRRYDRDPDWHRGGRDRGGRGGPHYYSGPPEDDWRGDNGYRGADYGRGGPDPYYGGPPPPYGYDYGPSPGPPPARPGGRRGRDEGPPGVSLLVRNVSNEMTTQDLQIAFGRIGDVRDVYIPRDFHSQQPKGFAFVEYATPDMALEARNEMDRFLIKGRELEVVFAQERRKTPNEMRGRAVDDGGRSRSGGRDRGADRGGDRGADRGGDRGGSRGGDRGGGDRSGRRERSSSFERHKKKERDQRGSGKGDEPDAPPEEGRAFESPVESVDPPPKETRNEGGDEW